MKYGILGISLLLAFVLLAAGSVSAATLNFDKSVTSGDVLNGKLDIVKVGGYVQGDYQYFYIETRDAGIDSPPVNSYHSLSIIIDAEVDGSEQTEYVDIYIKWENDNGVVNVSGLLTTATGGLNMLNASKGDIVVNGNRVTTRMPAVLLENADVLNVEFVTTYLGSDGFTGDDVYYYPSSSGSGGGDNGSTSGGGYDSNAPLWAFGLVGVMYFACLGIWFIIWLLVALWAYKDAKKKCNEHPGLWFVVVFFLGLIGIIIYIIVVKDECQKKQMGQGAYYEAPPPPPQ